MAAAQADDARAAALFAEGMRLACDVEDSDGIAWFIAGLIRLTPVQSSAEQQALFLGAVAALLDQLDVQLGLAEQTEWDHQLESARAQLEAELFARAWATGWSMTVEQAARATSHTIGTNLPARSLPSPP